VEVHVAERARLPWGVDSHTPTDTRLYDYALGGKDNYAVDRVLAHRLLSVAPEARHLAAENNRFVRRAVRHLLAAGVRQFLDVGCGLPRRGNVHDLAGPESRVVYVDYDPVAVTHYEAMLSGGSSAAVIHADARHPAQILRDPVVTEMIAFNRPVALLFTLVLHFVDDEEDPAGIAGEFRDAVAPGSHLVVSHATFEGKTPAAVEAVHDVFAELRESMTLRGREAVAGLFDGFELLDPGLVPAPDWRPDRPYRTPSGWLLAGVGRKPTA
jgi:SAM-dependent methyltransferase